VFSFLIVKRLQHKSFDVNLKKIKKCSIETKIYTEAGGFGIIIPKHICNRSRYYTAAGMGGRLRP
jgi:hypothetical protein